MIFCILCLGETRTNKVIEITSMVDSKTTFEDAIRQQITYADTLLSRPSLAPVTCTTCYRIFKNFYEQLAKIHQNQSFSLQVPVKSEVDDEVDLSTPQNPQDKPQVEFKSLEMEVKQIKIEPEFIEDGGQSDDQTNDDFEWEMDESTVWLDEDKDENQLEVPKGSEVQNPARNLRRKRNSDPKDPDYEVPVSETKTSYIRYLKKSAVTPEMLASGQSSVTIDGVEYRIPKNIEKAPSKSETKSVKTKNTEAGDERVRKFLEIKCELCGDEFPSFFRLGKHFRRHHPDTEVFLRCCGRKFYRRLVLLDHLDSHDDSVVHECTECHKIYKTDKILKIHIDKIHNNKYQTSMCNICGRTLKSQGALKKHLIVHEEDPRQFECYICKKSKYKNFKLLQVHFSTCHNPERPARSVCHICSAVVRTGHLKNHMLYQHSDVEIEKIQCEICDHWIMKTRMHIHRRKHAMGGVSCKICGKYLKSYGSLYSHNKIVHENCKNFKCDYCGKAFYKEKKLNEHVAARHTREYLFKCRVPGCGREFRAEGNWKMHERKAHPEEYEKNFAPFYKRAPTQEQNCGSEEVTEEGAALPPFNYF